MNGGEGLIDLHHHIVFGVDDGAKDSKTAVQMLKIAADQGITDIVCTSHTGPGKRQIDRQTYNANLKELQKPAEALNITLHPGSEVFFTEKTIRQIKDGAVQLIAPGYILVEFEPQIPRIFLLRAIRDINALGLIPVLAHVERYTDLHDHLEELRKERAVVQMNAQTVLRAFRLFPDRWSKRALAEGMIDVVASDAHDIGERRCRLGDAYQALKKSLGNKAEKLCRETPNKLLHGEIVLK